MANDTLARAQRASKRIPPQLRFPLLTVLSLVLSTLSYSFMESHTGGELAEVSRVLDQWWHVALLVGWRITELSLAWYGGFDPYDIGALVLLSHGPSLYLLTTFYAIRPWTVLSSLVIDTLATYIPFRILRPLSAAHAASTSSKAIVPNNAVLTDVPIAVLETIFASGIYSVVLYTAYKTFLPRSLVLYFEGIKNIETVYRGDWVTLFPVMWILGIAAKSFIFTPAVVAIPTAEDAKAKDFDPASATILETLLWNVWGFSTRTKVVIKRTGTLMLVSGLHTFLQTWVTIDGVEAPGAFAYALVWVVAAALTGTGLGIVSAA